MFKIQTDGVYKWKQLIASSWWVSYSLPVGYCRKLQWVCGIRRTIVMVLTKDVSLPSEEDLTVQEVEVSTPGLRAAAFHMGKACENANNVSELDC